MNNTVQGGTHGHQTQDKSTPRAVVHKKILEAAESHPNASIEGLAKKVDGASGELVERVLNQYGDPASTDDDLNTTTDTAESGEDSGEDEHQPTEATDQDGEPPSTQLDFDSSETEPQSDTDPTETPETSLLAETRDSRNLQDGSQILKNAREQPKRTPVLNPDQLSQKQLEVLRAIRENPHATQSELAEQLDVCRATISHRVNGIEGFDWSDRQEIVARMFEEHELMERNDSNKRVENRIEDLSNRIVTLEQTLNQFSESNHHLFDDTELASKVIKACIESDRITEDEEEEIIAELLKAGRTATDEG